MIVPPSPTVPRPGLTPERVVPAASTAAALALCLAAAPVPAQVSGPAGDAVAQQPRSGLEPPAQDPSLALDPAPYGIRYRGHVSRLRVNPLFVLPGERVTVEAVPTDGDGRRGTPPAVELRAPEGRLERLDGHRWAWTAPERPGFHRLSLGPRNGGPDVAIHAYVLVPMEEAADGELNGYRVGRYPSRPFRGLSRYRPPDGLIEVTRENRSLRVSPHFRLGDFLCKQSAGWPRYVVLKERLLWKLEALLAGLNRRYGVESLHVMSGYRTPSYNRSIGQGRYSRHLYGDAADVYVDEAPRDGRMDDVNGDGRVTRGDARAVYRAADRLGRRGPLDFMIGGLAHYPATGAHGPFVHVDARGYRARW